MQSFAITVNALLPIILLVLFGYYLRQKNLISLETVYNINQLVFLLFLPISLFRSTIDSDFSLAFKPKLIFYSYAITIVLLVFFIPLQKKLFRNVKQRGVLSLNLVKTNSLLLGLPLIESLFGAKSVGVMSMLVAFMSPLLNISSIITLLECNDVKLDLKHTLKKVFLNPFVIAIVLAFVVIFTEIRIPKPLYMFITDIDKMCKPVALIAIGGMFNFTAMNKNSKILSYATVMRLIIIPAIVLGLGICLGFRDAELMALLIMFGGPQAVSTVAMVGSMGGDSEFGSQLLLTSTVCSALTIFVWIFIFIQTGMFAI